MFCGVHWGGGVVPHSEKRKIKPIGDRQYEALDQVYQFINEALLGVFRVWDMCRGKKLIKRIF